MIARYFFPKRFGVAFFGGSDTMEERSGRFRSPTTLRKEVVMPLAEGSHILAHKTRLAMESSERFAIEPIKLSCLFFI